MLAALPDISNLLFLPGEMECHVEVNSCRELQSVHPGHSSRGWSALLHILRTLRQLQWSKMKQAELHTYLRLVGE